MKTIRLGDYCKITAGGDKPKIYSLIKTDRCFVPIYSNGIENSGLAGYTNKPTIHVESVTVAARGSCGYAFFRDTPYVPIIRLISIIPIDENMLDTKYLFYLLKLRPYRGIGSVQSQITVPQISDYRIEIIDDIIKQRKIAKMLYDIDLKIDINNKINAELESMAKTLYDYWFLQFEFPNEEGKPYKSSGGKMVWNEEIKMHIPKNWSVHKIITIADLYQPKTISGNEILKDGKYFVYGANGILGKYNEFNHRDNEIAICCRGASCGEFVMTLPYSWITGNAMVVKAKNDFYKEYIYFGLSKDRIEPFISGSAQPQITRTNLENMKVLVPEKRLIEEFNKYIIKIREKIQNSTYQNIELTSVRDFLFPLLMNGQVIFK